jgi:DNA-binding protein Fis
MRFEFSERDVEKLLNISTYFIELIKAERKDSQKLRLLLLIEPILFKLTTYTSKEQAEQSEQLHIEITDLIKKIKTFFASKITNKG